MLHTPQRIMLTYEDTGGIIKAVLQQRISYHKWQDIRELPVSADGKILLSGHEVRLDAQNGLMTHVR